MTVRAFAVPLVAVALAGCSHTSTPAAVRSLEPTPSDVAGSASAPAGSPSATPEASSMRTAGPSASPAPGGGAGGACTGAQVRLSVHVGQHSAGSAHQPLVVTALRACRLDGAPGVRLLSSTGAELAAAVAADQSAPPLALAAGQSAYALLDIANADNYPAATCRPAQSARISVHLPGGGPALVTDDSVKVCTNAAASQLHIEPFRAGQGM